jgi:phage gpG-like protein
MAGISTKISLSGIREVQNLLGHYALDLGGGNAELHERFGIQALNWVDRNFRAQGGLLSTGPWAKLTPNTIAGRRRASSVVLQDTGQLRQSFTMQFSSTEVVIGTADQIAAYHERGTRPYTIRPVRAKALAFPVAEGGFVVKASFSSTNTQKTFKKGTRLAFAQEVHHPGLPARRMLPTREELLPLLIRTTIGFLRELRRGV